MRSGEVITHAAAPAIESSPNQLGVFQAGAQFNRVFFYLQELWILRNSTMMGETRKLARELALALRDFVPPQDKDDLQQAIKASVLDLLDIAESEALAEDIVLVNQELELQFPQADPNVKRKEILEQVLQEYQEMRAMIFDSIGDDRVALFRLGEIIDQGLCRPDIYRFIFEEPTDPKDQGKNLLGHCTRQPGDILPDNSWYAQVKVIWKEAGFAESLLPSEIQSPPSQTLSAKKHPHVVAALDATARYEIESRRLRGVKPVWDPATRELWFDRQMLKAYSTAAENQTKLLDVFQEDEWAAYVDDPLDSGKARDTVHDLQKNFKDTPITFSYDSNQGEGRIGWKVREQS